MDLFYDTGSATQSLDLPQRGRVSLRGSWETARSKRIGPFSEDFTRKAFMGFCSYIFMYCMYIYIYI